MSSQHIFGQLIAEFNLRPVDFYFLGFSIIEIM